MTMQPTVDKMTDLSQRLLPRLQTLYGARAEECLSGIQRVLSKYDDLLELDRPSKWDERDIILIAYADQVQSGREHPLAALSQFLQSMELHRSFSMIHLLPFCPASSDDGFSVIDYRQVDPAYGDWEDIATIGEQFDLVFDLVLNHASSHSQWFRQYLQGVDPYVRFFAEADLRDDLSRVVRPRTSPLLTPFETSRGVRQLWTTFSPDQVDLNYREPRVLEEIVDVLLGYIRCGARILRLDAIAFLWKVPGTRCLNLPQTHQIVKLLRDIVDVLEPGTLLLTETNVPHLENVSYWGDSDESHLIYNFSLPPLLLDALLTGDGTYLNRWLAESQSPPDGTTLLNFTASHDGIGVRPLESLVPAERLEQLVAAVRGRQGLISSRVGPEGHDTPYELNITYFDALGASCSDNWATAESSALHVSRFMASQALMLSLRGIPAVYFPSLLGTPNDIDGVQRTGRARSINRRKFQRVELSQMISTNSRYSQIWEAYLRLLNVRVSQPAFHPDARQELLFFDNPAVVAFLRSRDDLESAIFVAANLSHRLQTIDLKVHSLYVSGPELLSGSVVSCSSGEISLKPYQVVWLPVRCQASR